MHIFKAIIAWNIIELEYVFANIPYYQIYPISKVNSVKNKKRFAIIPIFLFDTWKITQQIKVFEYGTEYKGVSHTCQEDEGAKT